MWKPTTLLTAALLLAGCATVSTVDSDVSTYQGQVRPDVINMAGLSERGLVENAMGPGIANSFNFMGRGLVYSDVVTTVSPTYANEIMTPEYGERLDAVMRSRRDRVTGILNGIDGAAFDPATDRAIAATYDADSPSAKATCKAALQREMGLEVAPRAPLLGIVSRLVEQKGLDLLNAIIPTLMGRTEAQLVLLGSGAPYLQDAMQGHAAANPGRIAVRLGFDAALAQRIYAGSDMFLMPSRFEPCGLGQMIALRYGSVPVVRATGGLNDTVREGWDGNGFVFHQYEARHFMDAIDRALAAYADARSWSLLRTRGMREDNSWSNAAERYVGVYRWALQLRGRSA